MESFSERGITPVHLPDEEKVLEKYCDGAHQNE
jgi:hypothetical protein